MLQAGLHRVRLDDLVLKGLIPAPDHIKIDVDGIEPKVVAGARETLETQPSGHCSLRSTRTWPSTVDHRHPQRHRLQARPRPGRSAPPQGRRVQRSRRACFQTLSCHTAYQIANAGPRLPLSALLRPQCLSARLLRRAAAQPDRRPGCRRSRRHGRVKATRNGSCLELAQARAHRDAAGVEAEFWRDSSPNGWSAATAVASAVSASS